MAKRLNSRNIATQFAAIELNNLGLCNRRLLVHFNLQYFPLDQDNAPVALVYLLLYFELHLAELVLDHTSMFLFDALVVVFDRLDYFNKVLGLEFLQLHLQRLVLFLEGVFKGRQVRL